MSLHNIGKSLKLPTLWNSGCRQANEAREHHFTPETKKKSKNVWASEATLQRFPISQ